MVIDNIRDLYRIWSERLRDAPCDGAKTPHTVALVLDNAGPELVADFCLAEYLIESGFTTRVVFYPKVMPWYVSDVTANDIKWILNEGLSSKFLDDQSLIPLASKWTDRWRSRFDGGQFLLRESPFWTYAYPYEEMAVVDRNLHKELTTGTDVILFKVPMTFLCMKFGFDFFVHFTSKCLRTWNFPVASIIWRRPLPSCLSFQVNAVNFPFLHQ